MKLMAARVYVKLTMGVQITVCNHFGDANIHNNEAIEYLCRMYFPHCPCAPVHTTLAAGRTLRPTLSAQLGEPPVLLS